MKKPLSLILMSLCVVPLASCSETEWSWWDNNNLAIEREIPEKDAKAALDSSLLNASMITSVNESYSLKTFYKNYLSKYTTEEDSNQTISQSVTKRFYNNNVLVTNDVYTKDQSYLHASTASVISIDTFKYADDNKDIHTITSEDYGYSEKTITEGPIYKYTTEEDFKAQFVIGSKADSSVMTGKSTTYGFSKNNEIIIEIMETEKSTYTVKFNNTNIPQVKNIYTVYRLQPIKVSDKEATYIIDYYKRSSQILIGFDVFNEPLKEPYVLETEESVKSYSISDNGTYDKSQIPTPSDK